ncbi:UNVERIFIED_CONTAM: tRNA nucleotidyltransferase (CCA-adding enzyme) [Acetivibrio alkalicellulosi]
MEIIIGHINIDFDCLASMIAAGKIYRDAQMVLQGIISKEVREFINLYRDIFSFKLLKQIDVEKITKVIVVDTHSKSRLGKEFSSLLSKSQVDFLVYDHHPLCEDPINGILNKIEKVGANTTLLIEEIKNSGIEISSLEATVFALGIYADTNRLTYQSTTARDAYAIAFLLSKNASLQVIESHLNWTLTDIQREFMDELNKNIEVYDIKGYSIAFAKVRTPDYVNDAAYLTGKLLEEHNYDAFFSILKMGTKTYIVGRSMVDEINIGQVLSFFGGAGHKGAGSAKTCDDNLENINTKLICIIKNKVHPVVVAKDIMSTPVKTVPDDTTIVDANMIISRFGHSGLPVVKDDKLTGIISRRDVEKALSHGFGGSPVKGYMSKSVICINEDTTVRDIQRLLIQHNIGRLPVMRGNSIVGIVTRSDIIRILFGESITRNNHKNLIDENLMIDEKINLKNKIEKLPKRIGNVLKDAGQIADELGYNVYAVGGFARDLILDQETLDIDIVLEGDVSLFSKRFAEKYGAKVVWHEKFKTALVLIYEDFKIDIVTARKEYYEYPAALPTIEKGSIKDDLFRRDFTINCIAIKLNDKDFGNLVDFYGGRRDIREGIIRILHNLSFIEDPTRILRAIKFEKRYNFNMDKATEEFAKSAIDSGALDKVSIERINFEFFTILKEINVLDMFERMDELRVLDKIYPEIVQKDKIKRLIKMCIERLDDFKNNLNCKANIDKILLYMLMFHSANDLSEAKSLAERFKLTKEFREEIQRFIVARDNFKNSVFSNFSNYEVYNTFKGLSIESIYVLYLLFDKESFYNMAIGYINKLRDISLCITGNDLKEMGITPGPFYKNVLDRVLKEKINGDLSGYEEEIEFVKKISKQECEENI